MIFPLIKSCLPEELIRVWQRSLYNKMDIGGSSTERKREIRLKNLMSFLRNDVENEHRISLATEGFGLITGKKPIQSADS